VRADSITSSAQSGASATHLLGGEVRGGRERREGLGGRGRGDGARSLGLALLVLVVVAIGDVDLARGVVRDNVDPARAAFVGVRVRGRRIRGGVPAVDLVAVGVIVGVERFVGEVLREELWRAIFLCTA
jgi:hypothetical protein